MSTMAALKEFQNEQTERQEKFDKLYRVAETKFEQVKNIADFEEDWNLSQFWYSQETAETLAKESLRAIGVEPSLEHLNDAKHIKKLAIISAPSVYSAILKLFNGMRNLAPDSEKEAVDRRINEILKNIYLLEFDSRFQYLTVTPEYFILYDFNKPLAVPPELKGKLDVAVIDPPFLSDECHTKTALTARYLLAPQNSKTIICTGERVSEIIKKVYPGSQITTFFPQHEKGLSNEFRCYANFECASWKWI